MGYFCIPESDSNEDRLACAKSNIDLYLRTHKQKPEDYKYLLEMAWMLIKEVTEKIEREQDESNRNDEAT